MMPIIQTTKGLFITLEGGDGTGKSTVAKALSEHLVALGQPAICTREPGGTPLGLELRRLLLSGDFVCSLEVQLLIVNAARVAHWQDVIRPALERGMHVVCDRFVDSTRVYQGLTQPYPAEALERVNALHKQFLSDVVPDLTLILDLDPKRCVERVSGRGAPLNHFDAQPLSFHAAVRSGFRQLAQQGSPYHLVSCDASLDDVIQHCWDIVASALLSQKSC